VVAIQYCRLFFNRSTAHVQGSNPRLFAENSYPGTLGRVGSGVLLFA
jgi:hypothetical protein